MSMSRWIFAGAASALSLSLSAPALPAQVLHVDDRWSQCAIVIDPALTQDAWHQFVKEAGLVTYFRSLAPAQPLGRMNFEVAVMTTFTRIDDVDPAWNDTFVHPHATHWLFEGSALPIPGIMVRAGVSDRVDVGGYVTKSFGANYGMLGGQVQYALLHDTESGLAASTRVNAVKLFGPEDLDFNVYGLDFVASKQISRFSPYAGVSGYWARGQETTDKVDLEDESVLGLQGMVGLSVRVWTLRLGAEFNAASVPGYSFRLAYGT
jgi:hypothetical protein